MINTAMRTYDFYTIGEDNGYGQQKLPGKNATPEGQIKMAINLTSQSIQDNINYKGASYVGLTHSLLDDKYVIQCGDVRLKVLYINPNGRYIQVFMEEL